jgi:hypothetical protein
MDPFIVGAAVTDDFAHVMNERGVRLIGDEAASAVSFSKSSYAAHFLFPNQTS